MDSGGSCQRRFAFRMRDITDGTSNTFRWLVNGLHLLCELEPGVEIAIQEVEAELREQITLLGRVSDSTKSP